MAVLAATGAIATAPASASAHDGDTDVQRINLVSDQPGKAAIIDPNLVNAWGMSRGANSPIWVSDNGTGVSTLYRGAVGGEKVAAVPLVVSTPGGAPTGQVSNDTAGFVVPGTSKPALFVFAGEDGDLSAWNQAVSPPTQAVAVGHVDGAVYKGLALAHSPFGPLLLAANFHDNRIDVFDATFKRLPVDLLFHDAGLPHGYAPFNVTEVGDRVFVTYAKQGADRRDDVAGAGHGFVDVYTNYGALLHRFASRGVLNSPWGLAVAPQSFGRFAGDLLVGNFGDGRIHAFDLRTGNFEGTLRDEQHRAIVIDGLWGLLVGDAIAGGADSVWFSAGPDGEAHGLLGILRAD
ncbi:MAG: TIGR03118 family protein [Pseudonocardiales bacterium]|nr:MAG: TIGR03118 family protein [Pseudonocardiales bacterium]